MKAQRIEFINPVSDPRNPILFPGENILLGQRQGAYYWIPFVSKFNGIAPFRVVEEIEVPDQMYQAALRMLDEEAAFSRIYRETFPS